MSKIRKSLLRRPLLIIFSLFFFLLLIGFVFYIRKLVNPPSVKSLEKFTRILLNYDEEKDLGYPFCSSINIYQGKKLVFQLDDVDCSVSFCSPKDNRLPSVLIPVEGGKEKTAPLYDINQDGVDELIIELDSMGAHCCFEYHILSIGKEVDSLFNLWGGNADMSMLDLDDDGMLELLTMDDCFAYWNTSFAGSPMATVIFSFEGNTYVWATHKYLSLFADDLDLMEKQFRRIISGSIGKDYDSLIEFRDPYFPTVLLKLMLEYIYFGELDRAVALFALYPMDKDVRNDFIEDFSRELSTSRYWEQLTDVEPRLNQLSQILRSAVHKKNSIE